MALSHDTTYGDKYGPAMTIEDQAKADAYFAECVAHQMRFGFSHEEAVTIERTNLAYWAGYYDHPTRLRVEHLFHCKHPIFGEATDKPPTFETAFALGKAQA